MLLRRIELRSFRQFIEANIDLADGITLIQGANGAGKTTILESVKYALYGQSRGTMGTLPNLYHPGKMCVAVEFDLGDQRYRCERDKGNARLCKLNEGQWDTIAFTLSGVTNQVTKLLGLTDEQFCSSYFTEQKEIEFLKFAKSRQQEQIAQMLGIELIATAGKAAKNAAKVHQDAIATLQSVIESKERLQQDLKDKQASLAKSIEDSEVASRLLATTKLQVEGLSPKYEQAEEALQIIPRMKHRRDHGKQLEATLAEAKGDLAKAEIAVARRRQLDAQASEFLEFSKKRDELTKLLGQFGDREKLQFAIAERNRERQLLESKIVKDCNRALIGLEEELAKSSAQLETARASLLKATSDWQSAQHEAKAKLESFQCEIERLQTEIRASEDAVSKGICPTCGQKLEHGHSPKIDELGHQLSIAQANLSTQADLANALQKQPRFVADSADCASAAEKCLEKVRAAHQQALIAQRDQEGFASRIVAICEELKSIEKQLADSPTTFDREAYDLICERVLALADKHSEWQKLSHAEEQLDAAKKRHALRAKEFEQERAKQTTDKARLDALGMNEAQASAIRDEFLALKNSLPLLERQGEAAKDSVEIARNAVKECEDRLAKWEADAAKVETHRHGQLLYKEVSDAMNELRSNLNSEIRPKLASLAGETLAQITNHRYSKIEIDDSFKATLFDGESNKPVISGGEEDVLALALRIALSIYVLEKSGMPTTMLVMDEVFGSLDSDRRANVLEMFDGLREIFPQIVLISHVEGLDAHGDQILHVDYDTNHKRSTVSEAIPHAISL